MLEVTEMRVEKSTFIAVIVAAVVCTAGALSAAQPASGGIIMLGRPWSPATPNGAATAAAYMSIENHGAADDRLLGGSSPLAGKVEVHEMSMAGGIMSMHALGDGLAIPAGKTVSLEPQANYHLMLSGLKSPLKSGTQLPLTLNFAKAGMVHVEVPVLPIGSRGPAGAQMPEHMDHH
jgi:periplasmic copper chaperone A